jgi:membrane-associated phospholipid phosphatase
MTTKRRAVAGGLLAAPALLATTGRPAGATGSQARQAAGQAGPLEPGAGGWRTWVLASGGELQPPPPPGEAAARAELAELRALAARRDAAALDEVAYWDAGAPGYRWNELATARGLQLPNGPRAYRMLALLNVAVHDATVAAWAAKYRFQRPRPAAADPALPAALPTPPSPAYPCEHSAAAGAAAAVLSYLFPDAAGALAEQAAAAGRSRLVAGVQYPSDVAAGLDLGRAVGERVVAWARVDGSDVAWAGTVPEGPGLWRGSNPVEPLAGTWRTWALGAGDELRPPPPPAPDSAQRAAELEEVRGYARAIRDAGVPLAGTHWLEDPAGRPAPSPGAPPVGVQQLVYYYAPLVHLLWLPQLNRKLAEYRLDANPPRAARAYALVAVVGHDAAVACWEGKYHYWTARPVHFDPAITTLLPSYPHPDYPSGHAAVDAATGEVLAALFPRDAAFFRARSAENAASRFWAGIHFPSACEAGLTLGRAVGQRVAERARGDGAA